MTALDWLRALAAACATACVVWGAVCYRIGARRDRLDDAAQRHPAGKQRPLRIVR